MAIRKKLVQCPACKFTNRFGDVKCLICKQALPQTEDAVVKDEGRQHRGRVAIRDWMKETIEKYDFKASPIESSRTGTRTVVLVSLSGKFPGSPITIQYEFTVEAWVDHFATWKRDIAKKRAAGQDTRVDEERGAQLERAGVAVPAYGSRAHRVSALMVCRLGRAREPADRDALLPDYRREPDAAPPQTN